MNKKPLILISLILFSSSMLLIGQIVLAQSVSAGWAPPNDAPPIGGVHSLVDLSATSQIKKEGLGVDTGSTLGNLPAGSGFYASTGSVMVDWPGATTPIGASPSNSIATNGRIRSNGVISTGGIQSDVLRSTGVAEKVVCVDLATGKLKLCGIVLGPAITFTAAPTTVPTPQPVTLTWSTTTAVSCVGTNFSTGPGSPPNGTTAVFVAATTTYTITCTDAAGQSNSRSATVTMGVPAPTASITATPSVMSSGQSTNVVWSSTNAGGCVPIAPTTIGFNTGGLANGNQIMTLTAAGIPRTYWFTIRCTGPTGLTADAQTSVLVNP